MTGECGRVNRVNMQKNILYLEVSLRSQRKAGNEKEEKQ